MRLILLFATCFLLTQLSAQDSTFHLKNYKYRTSGYHALEMNIGLNGGLTNSKNPDYTEIENRSLALTPSFISYYRIKSLDNRLHTSSVQFAPSYNFNKTGNSFEKRVSRDLRGELIYNRNDKFYKKGNNYLELGNSLGGTVTSNREEVSPMISKSRNYGLYDNIMLGIGKGRIEAVQDAQMALFILNDLKNQGLITNVDAALTNEFAQLITDINNRRIFDGRKRRIYELSRIDSFLRNNNIAPETNIRHFTTVNDNWSLAFNPLRFSGTNLYFRIMPSFGTSNLETNSENNSSNTNTASKQKFFAIAPHIGIEKFIPVNLNWQRNMGIDLSWQKSWNDLHFTQTSTSYDFNLTSKTQSSLFKLTGFYGIGFYPNNRTLLNASVNFDAYYIVYDIDDRKDEFLISPFFQFDTDFFISYRSGLSADLQVGYISEERNFLSGIIKRNSLNANFSIGFSHIIF